MPNVLVTGADGQLGKTLASSQQHYPEMQVLFANKATLDITNRQQLHHYFKNYSINYVVNCAAYTQVDQAEKNLAQIFEVNVQGPAYLGELALTYGFTLLHISTNYVFDGMHTCPLTETMPPQPINAYGKSKWAGEKKLLAKSSKAYIIRTAWLYSLIGNNFFVKILEKLSTTQQPVHVVNDQIGNPTYAGGLADVIWKIIRKIDHDANSYLPGVYHYANEGIASWYGFAYAIQAYTGCKKKVIPILSKDFPTLAKRPAYSVLNTEKIKKTFHIRIPHWREGLKKCIQDLKTGP